MTTVPCTTAPLAPHDIGAAPLLAALRPHHFGISVPDLDAAVVPGAAPLPADRRVPNLDLRTHGNKHMCFEVPDVPAAVAALREAGADIAFELVVDGNPTAFIRDISGNLIELLQPFAADLHAA